MEKSAEAFRTISEVADDLELPQHVLRFWETRFVQIKPLKRGGGRRYYRPDDVDLLRAIRHLLYDEGYTIKGVQRILKEHGVRAVAQMALTQTPPPPAARAPRASDDAPLAAGPANAPPPTAPRDPTTASADDLRAARRPPPAEPGLFDRTAVEPAPRPPDAAPRPESPPRADLAVELARPAASLLDAARDALRPRFDAPPAEPVFAAAAPIVEPPRQRLSLPPEPRFAPAPAAGFRAQEIERLKAVLYELSECERLLAAARGG